MAFEIWQAKGRITSIDNPVRMRLLRHLERGPATLNGLVAATRKTKGTLSALHLPPLLSAGVVEEAQDPTDARVKWYKLTGHRLGSSAVDAAQLRDAVLGYVQTRGLIPLRPLLEILDLDRLLRAAKPEYVESVAQGRRLHDTRGK